MTIRIGVDIGGTFTDVVIEGEGGRSVVLKVPSTPEAPEDAVLHAMEARPELRQASLFLHGTTVGLNAILQRRGATVGMLVTRGFRDVLEIGRGDRREPYLLSWRPSSALVPRWLRLSVSERIRGDGAVERVLDEGDVAAAFEVLVEASVETIAVCFLNAYRNPAHELAAEGALRDLGWEREIVLSHRVSGEYREYERTCTTVLDAFIRPAVGGYLRRLEAGLRRGGFGGSALVTRSGGGVLRFGDAAVRPIETVMSGPVAGAQAAAALARDLALDDVLAIDIGGTSADCCVITGGAVHLMYEGRVDEWPVQVPWIDVRSIGAGGGSIASVDDGGLLGVGPTSAGAIPGPACYDRGGIQATVTDAALTLGMLADGEFAGGMRLQLTRARDALALLDRELGLGVERLAVGIMTVLNASMADALRLLTAERGIDPRGAALIAFGGAGPLFACHLARELGAATVAIPPYPGNFSAWGLLGMELIRSAARTRIMPLRQSLALQARETLAEIFDELRSRDGMRAAAGLGAANAATDAAPHPTAWALADIRYSGQEHSLTIPLGEWDDQHVIDAGDLEDRFVREYLQLFDHTMPGELEIVAYRGELRQPLPARPPAGVASAAQRSDGGQARTWSFAACDWRDFRVLPRSSLAPGSSIAGPTILLEDTATTYVDVDFVATADPSGALVLRSAHDD